MITTIATKKIKAVAITDKLPQKLRISAKIDKLENVFPSLVCQI